MLTDSSFFFWYLPRRAGEGDWSLDWNVPSMTYAMSCHIVSLCKFKAVIYFTLSFGPPTWGLEYIWIQYLNHWKEMYGKWMRYDVHSIDSPHFPCEIRCWCWDPGWERITNCTDPLVHHRFFIDHDGHDFVNWSWFEMLAAFNDIDRSYLPKWPKSEFDFNFNLVGLWFLYILYIMAVDMLMTQIGLLITWWCRRMIRRIIGWHCSLATWTCGALAALTQHHWVINVNPDGTLQLSHLKMHHIWWHHDLSERKQHDNPGNCCMHAVPGLLTYCTSTRPIRRRPTMIGIVVTFRIARAWYPVCVMWSAWEPLDHDNLSPGQPSTVNTAHEDVGRCHQCHHSLKMDSISMAIVTLCWLADGLYFSIICWFVKVKMKRQFCFVLAQLGLHWM